MRWLTLLKIYYPGYPSRYFCLVAAGSLRKLGNLQIRTSQSFSSERVLCKNIGVKNFFRENAIKVGVFFEGAYATKNLLPSPSLTLLLSCSGREFKKTSKFTNKGFSVRQKRKGSYRH